MFFKIGVFKIFANITGRDTCEISEVFKITFFYRTPPVAVSVKTKTCLILLTIPSQNA